MQNTDLTKIPNVLANKGLACYNCFKDKSTTNLSRCSACSRVSYCGNACQKENWPKHKPLCKAFKVVETNDGNDIYAPFLFLDVDKDTNVVTDMGKLNQCIDRTTQIIMNGLERELQRPLRIDERNLVGWEPRCIACGRSDSVFRIEASLREREPLSKGLKPCPDCSFSFYCSTEHWEVVKDRHKNEPCIDNRENLSQCAMNKLCVRDVKFSELMLGAGQGEFKWAPERLLLAYRSLKGLDWKDFMPELIKTFAIPQLLPMMDDVLRGASEGLSMPLSILWGLENLHINEGWTRQEKLEIHVLGVSQKELLAGQIFEEILHRLPLVKVLKLTLIGPELEASFGMSSREFQMDVCSECSRKNRRRIHDHHPKTYHDYVSEKGDTFVKPDLAIAFDSGLSQADTSSWKKSIDVLIRRGIPSLFTAFNKDEAEAEFAILRDSGANLHSELGPRPNPWGSEISRSEPNKVVGFYASNGWLSGGFS